jgi:hypothetical protein
MLLLPITPMLRRMVFIFSGVTIWGIVGLRSGHCTCADRGAFNQLVEFTPIKPNAATLRAIVNFYALAFGHQEI